MITCMRVLNAAAKSAVIPCCAVVLVAACAKHPGVPVDGRGNKLPGARHYSPTGWTVLTEHTPAATAAAPGTGGLSSGLNPE